MKTFKKRHNYLPSRYTIERLLRRAGDDGYHVRRYLRELEHIDRILPREIREATLARMDPNKRMNIAYYPDLRTFLTYETPNRSLPVGKFLDMFRGMIDPEILDATNKSLTDYTVTIRKEPEAWLEVYADEGVHSCMSPTGEHASNRPLPACYAHPENSLAIAALHPPGSTRVIARTIVNTDEKWYVRLFGDALLVEKLQELGYRKMHKHAKQFKMYGWYAGNPRMHDVRLPYFDFYGHDSGRLPRHELYDTYNPATNFAEVIINPGVF